MKIVVLAGGLSTERNVSLVSGTMVCSALRERGHKAVLIDAYMGLEGQTCPPERLFEELPELAPMAVSHTAPDLDAVKKSRKLQSPDFFGEGVLDLCRAADVVFLALHGECGEDGRIQAAFDLMGIAYTGSGYRGSAVAMDKALTKDVMKAHGIKTPEWTTVTYEKKDIPALAARTAVPCVVKVPRGGSSIGVTIVKERQQLPSALESALTMDNTVVIEAYIDGGEFTCGVLEDRALPSVEIVPQVEFYDYESKYQPGATMEICPGRVSPELEQKMQDMALVVHRALGLAAYSRCDFMIDKAGEVYCLEVNTLPGMTPTSLVPQEAAVLGISYGELCERIISASLQQRQNGRG